MCSAQLWHTTGLEWAVSNRPAPLRSTGRDYVSARADGAMAAVRSGCHGCPHDAAGQTLTAAAVALAQEPVELPTRTPLVNGVDVAAAAVALAYLSDAQLATAVESLRDPTAGAAAIGSLSDTLLMRYGGMDMAPGMLAYFQEVCRDIPGWADPPAPGLVPDFLWALHAPCAHLPAGPAATVADPGMPLCVAGAADDRVTPAAYAQQWLGALPGARALQVPGARHTAPETAIDCYQQVRLG